MQAQGDNRQEPHKEDDPALPFQRVTSFKLLGLVLDQVWSFGGHMNDTQRKMKLRTAILQKVSNSVWGLENRILTITVHALLESIINYGLTVIGSAASTEDFESVDKTVLNPVARKVAGVGFSARREVLYPLADMRSTHNHYLLKVANVLDRTLRASNTQAQRRLRDHMSKTTLGTDIWQPNRKFIQIDGPVWPSRCVEEHWEWLRHKRRWKPEINEREISWWQYDVKSYRTEIRQEQEQAQEGNSIFHAQAEELRMMDERAQYTFQYTGLKDWRDVACKVLKSVGWKMECVYENTLYPQTVDTMGINWDNIHWSTMQPPPSEKGDKSIQVCIMGNVIDGRAVSTTVIKNDDVKLVGAMHLLGNTDQKNPWAVPGLALAAGLNYLDNIQILGTAEEKQMDKGTQRSLKLIIDYPQLFEQNQIERWKIYGAPDQPSPEHETINRILKSWTTDPMACAITLQGSKEARLEWEEVQQLGKKWYNEKWNKDQFREIRLRQIPLQQAEVKEVLKRKQDADEAKAIKQLAEEDGIQSVASAIYNAWDLDRRLIKECHVAMKHDRQLQVTFNNIVAATRFKTSDGQRLVRARCQRPGCGKIDSWEHFLQCYEVPDISHLAGRAKVEKIVEICMQAKEPNPVRPRPSEVAYTGVTGGTAGNSPNEQPNDN